MFTSEKQMVQVIKKNFTSMCGWDTCKFDTKILEEVNLGFGVADLVITKLSSKIDKSLGILTYFDAVIYKIIESEKEITFEAIKEITRANPVLINSSIRKLIKDSYVSQNDSLIQLFKPYKGISNDSIAIEAKLKNWRRALDQAFRYKWFAKRAFVVLDSSHIKPALSNIDEFKKLNVGLAEIEKEGYINLHLNPKKTAPIDPTMWMLMNEELRKSFLRKKK